MTRKLLPLILLVLGTGFGGLATAQDGSLQTMATEDGLVVGAIDWSATGSIQARGFGTDPDGSEARARRAAILDGRRLLLEIMQGVHLVAGVTAGDAEQASDVIQTRIQGVLRGAFPLEDTAVWDGENYKITMAVALGSFRQEIPALLIKDLDLPVAPISFGDRVSINPSETVSHNVLTNDLDRNADPLTATLVSGVSHGTLDLDSDGTFSYVHDGGDATSDTFVYRAGDGSGSSEDATVTILIASVAEAAPDAPDAPDEGQEPAAGVLDLLEQAHDLTLEALEAEPVRTPDQNLWRDVLALVDDATELAPSALDVLRARAQAYSYVHWHVRAWESWQAYLGAGGTLADPAGLTPLEVTSAALFSEAGTELALAHYQRDQRDEALQIYLDVLEQLPEQQEALTQAARIHLHAGRLEDVLPLLENLTQLDPDEALVLYLAVLQSLPVEEKILRVEALTGVASIHLDAERLEEALPFLERLAQLDPDDEVALGWLGRIHLGAERLEEALPYFERLAQLQPDDAEIIEALDSIRDSLVRTPDPVGVEVPPSEGVEPDVGGPELRPLPPIVISDHPRAAVETIGPRTGIILDASQFPIERAFYIHVYDETGQILRQLARFHYHTGTLDGARQRIEVGDNPEVFQVSGVNNGGFEVILNDREAQRFLLLLQDQDLIASGNAVILGGE